MLKYLFEFFIFYFFVFNLIIIILFCIFFYKILLNNFINHILNLYNIINITLIIENI